MCSIHSLHKYLIYLSVAKYTREAGVRTLERRIGAICRAVAVTVAENHSQSKGGKTKFKKKTEEGEEEGKEGVVEAARLALPPDLPIVIDEAAVEDILGVSVIVKGSYGKPGK